MEISKEVKNKIMIIITLVVFTIVIIFMYLSSANVGYKRGYDVSVTELSR